MNKQRLIAMLVIFLISLLAPEAQAATYLPETTVLFPAQQQDDTPRTAQLGENRGEIAEGSSEIWTYEGKAGDILTIKAEADKPANDTDAEERRQAGLLDMMLIVYAPDGAILAKADDIQTSIVTDAVIEGLQLPTDGTYQIEVLGLEKQGSGAYTLTLEADNATQRDLTPTPNPNWPTLTIENQLEETICYVYIVSSISSNDWGADWMLAEEVIFPNDSRQWHVESDTVDILLSDCYGNTLNEIWDFDVSESSTLTVPPSATDGPASNGTSADPTPTPDPDWPILTIENQLEDTICYVYITPISSDDWGADWMLAEEVIFPNDSRQWHVAPDIYDIALDDCDGNTLNEMWDFDVSESSTLTVLPSGTDGSVAQCAEGVQLFLDGKAAEAFWKLSEGFAGRESAIFANPDDEGICALILGRLHDDVGNRSAALEAYQVALNIFQVTGNREFEGATVNNIGAIYHAQGQYELALERFYQALEIRREVGHRVDEGTTLNNIGQVYRAQGRYELALEQYRLALSISREVGNRVLESSALNNMGLLYYHQGQYELALEQLNQALSIRGEVSDWAGEDDTLNNMALVYDAQGRYELALEKLNQALAISRQVGDQNREEITLNNIGAIYLNQGRFDLALEHFQQALAIMPQVGDQNREAATLSNIGTIYFNQGRFDLALEHFQQSLAIVRQVGDQVGEVTMLNNIGEVYRRLGHYQNALEQYQHALDINREVGDQAGEATMLNNIGLVYDHQGRYQDALNSLEQALDINHQVGDRASEGVTLNNIGGVYDNQGRYQDALKLHQQALAISREVGDRAGEGKTLNNIGEVYRQLGRYQDALEQYQQALTIKHDVGDRSAEATTLSNIGLVYNDQGLYSDALEQYQQALAISREVGERAGEGETLNSIGLIYLDQGDYQDALSILMEALTIRREIGDRAGEATTLNGIGGIYSNQGHYPDALEQYQQALAISREIGDRVGEGVALNNIGGIYFYQGRFDLALEYYQQALGIRHEVGDRFGEGITRLNIGFTYEQQGQIKEALNYYEQAMDVFESIRAIAGSEEQRASFIAEHADLYYLAVGLYHQQGQDEQAFLTSERGRARSFLDSLATGEVQLSDEELLGLVNQEREAYGRRQAAQDVLARVRAQNPPDAKLVADLEQQLEAAEEAYSKVQTNIEARGDELAALVPGRRSVPTLAEVQALLDEQTTLISYWVLREGTLAFVITRESLEVVELPDATRENLSTTLRELYLWTDIDDPHLSSLQALHSWLVEPLTSHLKTAKVGIIPHQLLHYVPFAALTDGKSYFGSEKVLFGLPSASALRFVQDKAKEAAQTDSQGGLVFGNPTTDEVGFAPLPEAAKEAETVAALLGTSHYIKSDATETQLRESVAGQKVVHLAAHGVYDSVVPLENTFIALAADGEHDGHLRTREVYSLDLTGSQLVTLSACQTQIGRLFDADEVVSAGDEIVGLTRAFFFAGTPTVLSSLWNVDDAATGELMSAFYRHWESGMSKAEALQAAQAEIRQNYPSPYYWAGFVLSGDAGESTVSVDQTRWFFAIVGATVLLVLLGIWVVSRRRRRS